MSNIVLAPQEKWVVETMATRMFLVNPLEELFPHLDDITKVCIQCCGNSIELWKEPKCKFCRKTPGQWRDIGFEDHSAQLVYLRQTWIKCQNYKQQSTEIQSIDRILVYLWGKPWEYFGMSDELRHKMQAIKAQRKNMFVWEKEYTNGKA